jgi:hypothetical protein
VEVLGMAIPPLVIVVIELELAGDPVLLDVEVNIMSFRLFKWR